MVSHIDISLCSLLIWHQVSHSVEATKASIVRTTHYASVYHLFCEMEIVFFLIIIGGYYGYRANLSSFNKPVWFVKNYFENLFHM